MLWAEQRVSSVILSESELEVKSLVLLLMALTLLATPGYGEMYKWVDEKGTVYFTDDPSKIPEKYRTDSETRKIPKEVPASQMRGKQATSSPSQSIPKPSEPQGFEVSLSRKQQVMFVEAFLNGKTKRSFVVDTGASYTVIDSGTANELGIVVDENTPFIPVSTVSDVILTPLVTLKSVQVGKAEAEDVDALIYTMPTAKEGLLGNSFLSKFRVVIDPLNSKMTLYSAQGVPSPDRPGGYDRDYWVARFRFIHYNLEVLRKLKATYERRDARSELSRINNAIRHFENQLGEWERKASFAGVPHNWRE